MTGGLHFIIPKVCYSRGYSKYCIRFIIPNPNPCPKTNPNHMCRHNEPYGIFGITNLQDNKMYPTDRWAVIT